MEQDKTNASTNIVNPFEEKVENQEKNLSSNTPEESISSLSETEKVEASINQETAPVVEENTSPPSFEQPTTSSTETTSQATSVETTSSEATISTSALDVKEAIARAQEEREQRRTRRARIIQAFAEVKKAYEEQKPIEVLVYSRVRGGLRVFYKGAPLFLPASHFHLSKSPTDDELAEVVNKNLLVMVHEIQEYDEGSMAVIVSRKKLLEEEFWNNLQVGQIVEGPISSIASFGVFINLGAAEGLIHISRLAPYRIANLFEYFKIGDTLKARVIEIDKQNKRISLSRKEFVETEWPASEQKYSIGSRHFGIVRRMTDFGAFVELEPLVEGLLRTSEISWTRRLRRPQEVLKVGDKIEVVVTSFNAEKKTIGLSIKRLTENPWPKLHEKYPINSVYEGKIVQVVPQGCVVSISPELDGFLPRSKMKKTLRANRIPFKSGDKIRVFISDIVPQEESLILGYAEEEEFTNPKPQQPKKASLSEKNIETKPLSSGISIMDMLSEEQKENLLKSLNK
ncbi:MAG: S1 RNA-binding domain-containing protein [Ignavibacteria bacterium]|nr:S1 RNA-binding domain-containing protein [Ignavibacteria bacterium]